MEIYVGKSDAFDSLSHSKGAKIFVYNHSTVYSDAESIDVSVERETNISLRKKIVNKLKSPYSDCEINSHEINGSSSELVHIFNHLNYTYRQNDCLNICYQKLLVQRCECFDFNYNAVSTLNKFFDVVRSCSQADIACMKEIFEHATDNYYATCRRLCPKECDSFEYEFDMSFSGYPTDVRLKRIVRENPHLTPEANLKSKLLKVNIHFNTLSYEIVTETAALSIPSLLSNIGGTLGLFLGFSVLNLCEMIELLSALAYVSVDMTREFIVFNLKKNHAEKNLETVKNPV